MTGPIDASSDAAHPKATSGVLPRAAPAESAWTPVVRNRLLRALPAGEYARLAPYLEPISIDALEILAEARAPLRHVYFPESAVVSIVRRLRDGATIEAGAVGREGMAGLAVLLGDGWSSTTLQGQMPGLCLRVGADAMRAALPELPTLAELLRRFALAFMDQIGQTLACNSLHAVEPRCARWLLAAQDGVGGDELHLTHDVLAQMLGVRRAGVTVAALALQRAGLIRYSRGRVRVLDRRGLEAVACECYDVVRANFDRLLGAARDGTA